MMGKKAERMMVVAITRIQGKRRVANVVGLDSWPGLQDYPVAGEMGLFQQSRDTGCEILFGGVGSMCEMDSGVRLSRQEDKGRVTLVQRRG